MLVYVDKILHLANSPKQDMDDFNCTYRLKEESVGPPKIYLGDNVKKFHMENRKQLWEIHCVDYLQVLIKNLDDTLSKDHWACIKQYGNRKRPYTHGYRPELDIPNELYADGISSYHTLIRELR